MPCLTFCLHTWAEGWSNQSMSCQLQHVTTMISHRPQWRQYSYVFSLTLSRGKENSWRNFPKVFSPVARGVIAQTKSVFVPTLSVAVPNSWAVRERSVHHHTRHLSQAWRGTPRVHQRPLASIIPVCGSREVMKRIVQLWSVHRRTQGTYQVKPTCSYWVWLQKQECTIFTYIYYMLYHSVRSFSISQVDVHLEHLYPNPLRRLPSAILCEHHVQKPPAELLQKHQWTLLSGSYFCKSWATRMLLANPPHPIHPTKVGLCGTIPTIQMYIRENDLQ